VRERHTQELDQWYSCAPPAVKSLLFAHYPTLLRQQAPEIAARDDAPLGAVDLTLIFELMMKWMLGA